MATLQMHEASLGYVGRTVLRKVSLHVSPGEVLAVVGPNGVGKSTLVKAASGGIPLLAGKVTIENQDLSHLSASQRARLVSVVSQATNLPPAFKAIDVVMMGRTPYLGWLERERASDQQIAMNALDRTDTIDLAERPMGELSGGEQQRVLIARALAQEAPVMLLDEPTAHLDIKHQDRILKLVRWFAHEGGMAIMIALHDLNLVSRFADRVILLSGSEVRKKGLPEEVLTPEELERVYGIRIHVIQHPIHGVPLVLSGE